MDDSEATADMEGGAAYQDALEQQQVYMPVVPAPGVSGSAPASTREEEADTEYDEMATESDDEGKAAVAAQGGPMPTRKPAPNRRSRASSPDWLEPPTLDDKRLTARQRARLEKEAGLAEDVQWHQMDMPPELAYTWKGKGHKAPNQMTEEEWLKRQEALERRRMRSLRDKREAEETVKAKIRKAVTARFRGKLGTGGESGTEGEAGAKEAGEKQETLIQPGWVKLRHNSAGCSIAWHPKAHPLSYPMAVAAKSSYPADPVDLPLQPPGGIECWRVPEGSSSSFKLGCTLAVQQSSWVEQQQQQGTQQADQQQQLWCVDDHGWRVGCLLQQQVIEALAAAGYEEALLQQQLQQQHHACEDGTAPGGGAAQTDSGAAAAAAAGDHKCWQGWQAVVKSLHRSHADQGQLTAVVVRLVPA